VNNNALTILGDIDDSFVFLSRINGIAAFSPNLFGNQDNFAVTLSFQAHLME
jgi:hypothetical protein